MKAVAITIDGNLVSEAGYKRLVESSKEVGNQFEIECYDASTWEHAVPYMRSYDLMWNWPVAGEVVDLASGLRKRAYKGDDRARCACAVSHYRIWRACYDLQQPVLVLEHDAEFIQPCIPEALMGYAPILGINDPRGATRKAAVFHEKVQTDFRAIQEVPHVDTDPTIPHGLAGNSAYIITPNGASQMLKLVHQYGLWPNDAIMCRQLVPLLSTTRTYYTRVQGLPSTTTQ